jgi:hypothetical protein
VQERDLFGDDFEIGKERDGRAKCGGQHRRGELIRRRFRFRPGLGRNCWPVAMWTVNGRAGCFNGELNVVAAVLTTALGVRLLAHRARADSSVCGGKQARNSSGRSLMPP